MSPASSASPLIRTKLRLPFTRPSLVERPRLSERLAQGLHGPLTLIVAPAGFGKTTLAVAAAASSGMHLCWLSLDSGDNQSDRFLHYLIAALQEADPSIGREAIQLLDATPPASQEAILTSLVNSLDSRPATAGEILLVLDDYQSLSHPAAHSAASFLLDHLPASLHLLIASRSDPLLPLARLRARGQVVELRAADLRFTVSEATQFLNEVMGLSLDAASVAKLEERTEGWIAGLQLAALSMRDREDKSAFIESFSGTQRFILDYLLEEVLSSQPQEVQRFLLHTSILERLTAPLCDRLMERGIGDRGKGEERYYPLTPTPISPALNSQSILEYLTRSNLFLTPLDDEGIWYRYHPLFADLLQARLGQLYPDLEEDLHAQAAGWLERQGMAVEAINHSLAAGMHDRAARLVEENTNRLLARGELAALMRWIDALPTGLRQTSPWLCVQQAYALAFAGRVADAEALLAQAEAASNRMEDRGLDGAIAALRSMTAVMSGRDAEAVERAQYAQVLLPPGDLWNRATSAWALGYARRSLGDLAEARQAFEEQIRLGREMGNVWTLVTGLTDLAQTLRAGGQLTQARLLFEEALAEAAQQEARSLGYIARMEAGLASVLYEQNNLDAARRLLEEAIDHMRQWPNPNHRAFAFVIYARVLRAMGDLEGAARSAEEAMHVRKRAALVRTNQRLAEAELLQAWLALQSPPGELAAQAEALLAGLEKDLIDDEGSTDDSEKTATLALARGLLAKGKVETALPLLSRVAREARSSGHLDAAIHALALSAAAYQTAGQGDQALAALEGALSIGEPGGYTRVFLELGRPFELLLSQWLARQTAGGDALQAYARRLLAQFAIDSEGAAGRQAANPPTGLVEALSPRELEVLHLLAQGAANQEIAHQLVVSTGTVKAHTASIYRKLEVSNRTQAVARARQLGILV